MFNSALVILFVATFGCNNCDPVNILQCGRAGNSQGLIVGGSAIQQNRWPWLASLYYLPDQSHFCGGSIVSENHIITAAHCIHPKGVQTPKSTDDVIAWLGKHNLSQQFERGSEAFYPTTIRVHPDWSHSSERYDGDIATLFSELAIRFTLKISSICLWGFTNINDETEGTVVGWGLSEKTGFKYVEDTPKEVKVMRSSLSQCYEDDYRFAKISSPRMFCAHGVLKDSGPCNGDSGKLKWSWWIWHIFISYYRRWILCYARWYLVSTWNSFSVFS